MKKDPVTDLLHRLAATQQPFLFLLEHSQSLDTRVCPQPTDDENVYRRAALRTPHENARRDWAASSVWWQHLLREGPPCVWVQTTPLRPRGVTTRVVDCGCGTDGWHDDSLLQDLDALSTRISNETASNNHQVVIVLDSLVPVVMLHGWSRTLQWLKQQQQPWVVVLHTNDWTQQQRSQLHDLADGWLWLHRGQATLLRQGLRERGNLVRETMDYDIEEPSGRLRFRVAGGVSNGTGANEDDTADAPTEQPIRSGVKKIQLQLEDDDQAAAKKAEPRIVVEDDDPEFDDYDEEDPDDDLDL